MVFESYSSLGQYILYCTLIFYEFPTVKALVGHNIIEAIEGELSFITAVVRRIHLPNIPPECFCGGGLVSRRHVITAEHCLYEEVETGVKFIIGSTDLLSDSVYYPAWWISYDQWATPRRIRNKCRNNDMMVVRLTSEVSDGLHFAEISTLSYSELRNRTVIGVGWGERYNNNTYPRILQVAPSLRILPVGECLAKTYSYTEQIFFLDPNYLCSTGDPFTLLATGDSGSPLIFMNTIVALSIGIFPIPEEGFNPNKINLHLRMDYYDDFLKANMV